MSRSLSTSHLTKCWSGCGVTPPRCSPIKHSRETTSRLTSRTSPWVGSTSVTWLRPRRKRISTMSTRTCQTTSIRGGCRVSEAFGRVCSIKHQLVGARWRSITPSMSLSYCVVRCRTITSCISNIGRIMEKVKFPNGQWLRSL